jgi:hypothetical protein
MPHLHKALNVGSNFSDHLNFKKIPK